MLRSLLLATTCAALSIGLSSGQGTSPKAVIPVAAVSPIDGKQMFVNYCSPCHGKDGKGEGALASGLHRQPDDLTKIAQMNRGRFPELLVKSALEFGIASSENRTSAMPAWGPVFGRISHLSSNDEDLRILNLIRFLESIQVK